MSRFKLKTIAFKCRSRNSSPIGPAGDILGSQRCLLGAPGDGAIDKLLLYIYMLCAYMHTGRVYLQNFQYHTFDDWKLAQHPTKFQNTLGKKQTSPGRGQASSPTVQSPTPWIYSYPAVQQLCIPQLRVWLAYLRIHAWVHIHTSVPSRLTKK